MDEEYMAMISQMKVRVQYTMLEQYGAFADLHTAAFLLNRCLSHLEELLEARAIPSVIFQGEVLIPLVPLLDVMEWYPAIVNREIDPADAATSESQIKECKS